jgi:preprotein translocase subunit SecB
VLGFSIVNFSAYYAANAGEDGEFEVTLPSRVPANLEEEMDYDAEMLQKGVRIAEFY